MATATAPAAEEHGERLQKGQLPLRNCVALSAAVMAPVIAVILNAPAAAGNGGAALPLAFLVAFIAIAFVAVSVIEFSRRLPTSGSFYTFVSHGLGGGAGFFTGWLYFAAFIIFESASVLGEETRDAKRNIPKAVFGAMAIIGAFYVFMMYSLAAGYHLNDPAQMKAFLGDSTPFPTIAHRYAHWLVQVIDIAAILGLFSCFLAVQNATVRVLFAMGRDRVRPPAMRTVHRRRH